MPTHGSGMHEHIVHTTAELGPVVDELLSLLPQKRGAHVLALSGELGVGKTTLVQVLAQTLGVVEHVTSPTFVVMRTYEAHHPRFRSLVHIDAYRVEDIREMEVLHIPELLARDDVIVCVEWPERIGALIPDDAIRVQFEITEGTTRRIRHDR